MKKLKDKKKQGIFTLVLAVLVISVILYFLFRSKPITEVLPTVIVDCVDKEDVELYGEYVGRVRAQQFVEIRARVEGYLEQMFLKKGLIFKKGRYYSISILSYTKLS